MKRNYFTKTVLLALLVTALSCQGFRALAFNQNNPKFVENKGQVTEINGQRRDDIKFTYHAQGTKLFITNDGIYYQFMNPISDSKMELHRVDMKLIGANNPTQISKEGKSEYYENFYLNGRAISNVHSYSKITFKNVYPKIDWVLYSKDDKLEYDFVLHPGADVNQIKMSYSNADGLNLNEDGSFSFATRLGKLIEGKPESFVESNHTVVNSKFVLNNSVLQFELAAFDKSQTLIIDPTLVWSRYAGGNQDEVINKVTDNMAFGTTASTFGIATLGGYQTIFGGTKDAFYCNFDNSGTIVYSTYFGGSGTDEAFSGLYVSDGANSKAVMVGQTNSMSGIAQAGLVSYANLNGSSDGFIAVFFANGTIQFSSYFGGNDMDYISDVKLSGASNDYTKLLLCGATASSFGLSASNSYQGGEDAFVSLLDLAGGNITVNKFAYFGGIDKEFANTVAVGKNNSYFLSGNTSSSSAVATNGAFDVSLGGSDDDFIACLDANFNVNWASYYGGSASEKTGFATNGSYCALDTSGNVYLLGNSTSGGLASSNGNDFSINGLEDFFLAKFDSLGNRIWATYYGGFLSDIATSIAINSDNLILLGGYSNSPFMDIDGIGFVGANHNNNDIDALAVEFNTDGQFFWSSPLGTPQGEEIFNSVAFTSNNIIGGGSTNSAFGMAYTSSSTYSGAKDGLLARINDRAIVTGSISNTSLCPGDSIMVPFTTIGNFPPNTIYKALLYTNFSVSNPIILGTNTTGTGIIHGYLPLNTGASFSGNTIKVVTNLPTNPPIASTSKTVGAIGSLPNAHIHALTSTSICLGNSVVLKSPSNTNIVFRQWQQLVNSNWVNISGANSISYSADSAGSYRVITTSVTGCDSTSNSINVTVQSIPTASITSTSQLFCAGDKLVLNANTGSGYTYQWFANNILLNGRVSDTLVVTTSGSYTVKVSNSAGCSASSVAFVATSLIKPPAQIVNTGSAEICEGQNVILSANNSPGVSYQWYKNDTLLVGATLRTLVVNSSGDYLVKEINTNNCDSTSNTLHVDVYSYPNPSILLNGLPYTCLGNSVNLSTQNQANYTFQWLLNGSQLASATDTSYTASASGNYTVTVTNHGICSTTSSSLEVNPAPVITNICYATVDANSEFNNIYFEKPNSPYIKRYVFLRETSGNTYTPVDSVDANAPGFIVDSMSNPNNKAWKYLMETVDSCDRRTLAPLANHHTCLFMTTTFDGAGTTTLDWNNYEGVNPTGAYYVILRADSLGAPFDSIDQVSYTSPTKYQDHLSNLHPKAYYKIEMKWLPNCTPSNKIMTGYSSTRSNIKNRMNMSCAVDTTINQNQDTLTVGESGAVYQWLDCSSGTPTPIPGEVAQSFVVSNNGTYSVIISRGNCVDTTRCVQISLGVNSAPHSNSKIKIAPNPASNSFSVFGLTNEVNEIELNNFLGEKCQAVTITKTSADAITFDTSKLAAGVYFVQIKSKDFIETRKLILDK